jgi:hypothetical protein
MGSTSSSIENRNGIRPLATPNETASGLIDEMKRRAEVSPLSGLNDRQELLAFFHGCNVHGPRSELSRKQKVTSKRDLTIW